jgi:hypothetical protein
LLTLVVLTYLWSGDAARRRRARMVVELLVRVHSTGQRSVSEVSESDHRHTVNVPAPIATQRDSTVRANDEAGGAQQ